MIFFGGVLFPWFFTILYPFVGIFSFEWVVSSSRFTGFLWQRQFFTSQLNFVFWACLWWCAWPDGTCYFGLFGGEAMVWALRMRIGVCLCLKTFGSKCWLESLIRWGCRMSSAVAWILWPDLLDIQGRDVICSTICCRTGPTTSRFILWKLEYPEFHAMKQWVLLCKQAKSLAVLSSRATVLKTVEWATQLPMCSG